MKNGKEITNQKEANNELFNCYNDPLTNYKRRLKHDVAQFWTLTQTPCTTVEQSAKCEVSKFEDKFFCALKNILKNKSQSKCKDGLIK